MDRDYNEKCIQALDGMYQKYGLDMNNANILDMIEAIKNELNVECGGYVINVGGACMSKDKFNELMLHALEEDYLYEIGIRNITLA